MGRRSRESCAYDYKVTINMTNIVDEIIRRLPGTETSDWELCGEELIIYMNDDAIADCWYCPATLESPEENEVDLINSVDEVDVDGSILEALHGIEKVDCDCEIDYESIEIEEYEPDPDRAYDEWRDRQFEEY
jgi:hypothetical protein